MPCLSDGHTDNISCCWTGMQLLPAASNAAVMVTHHSTGDIPRIGAASSAPCRCFLPGELGQPTAELRGSRSCCTPKFGCSCCLVADRAHKATPPTGVLQDPKTHKLREQGVGNGKENKQAAAKPANPTGAQQGKINYPPPHPTPATGQPHHPPGPCQQPPLS
jgi:hypothetical protein